MRWPSRHEAEHFRVLEFWSLEPVPWSGGSTKTAFNRSNRTVFQMTSAPGSTRLPLPLIVTLAGLLLVALGQAAVEAAGEDFDVDYSNEYDDVRPHLEYPDVPRLDKRIGDAAREFGQNITQAWHSMVDSFKNYFEELKSLFGASPSDPDAANEVFSSY
ncbi:uncharacterized protein Dana_GF26704 [Drosophila ananassae]|uniref:Uncharacterized protein n=1 Tax=Drosophila ananassae TaxID=7217 RepID=A0A0P8Y824_DROAN|nr:uncharacterized protein LOC26514113 [Drosophila ananassae]KPU75379.1 uncharacterized protein Dana_GF26704 [Drosophila ananassae]